MQLKAYLDGSGEEAPPPPHLFNAGEGRAKEWLLKKNKCNYITSDSIYSKSRHLLSRRKFIFDRFDSLLVFKVKKETVRAMKLVSKKLIFENIRLAEISVFSESIASIWQLKYSAE